MLASSTPKLLAVCAPIDSMEFVSADYNVCVTVTCHHRPVCRLRRAWRRRRGRAQKKKPSAWKGPIVMTVDEF
ncbi:hypothetical protein BTE54_13575 [Agrobacterium sp. YIC 4121]|nr:hypothetical protein BTE54_13575 [Agrobacterium sp. YIC 4121]